MDNKLYKVSEGKGYIKVEMWGDADGDTFEASSVEVMALHDKTHLNRFLCDIRELQPLKIDIHAQAQGIGMLMKIREFERAAFIVGGPTIEGLLHGSFQLAQVGERFRAFKDVAEAEAWITAPETKP